jgi:DNA-binding XRE family transcriptional regulator
MAQRQIASHLGTHRRRSGFSQLELARLVGHRNSGRVSRHERGVTVPPLSVALAYEAVFHVPVHELFPGIHEAALKNIEAKIAGLDAALGRRSVIDRNASAIARKLQFIRYDRPARKLTYDRPCTQES